MPWVGGESETNRGRCLGILTGISGNVTKRLKMQVITKGEKSAQSITIKKIVTEEHQVEKRKMKE